MVFKNKKAIQMVNQVNYQDGLQAAYRLLIGEEGESSYAFSDENTAWHKLERLVIVVAVTSIAIYALNKIHRI